MICLNEKYSSDNELVRMLNVLLSPERDVEAKKKELEETYGIAMKDKMEEDLNSMCNLSEWVEEIGAERGRKEGFKEGELRFAGLTSVLLRESRLKDLERAVNEPSYREQLYKELGM